MSLPSGYMEWANARGINGYHPDTWSPADLAAFRVWKRAAYVAKWRGLRAFDMHTLMPRARLREYVQEDLEKLRQGPPSRPYRQCPCHAKPRRSAEDRSVVAHGLAFIESFKPTGQAR